MLESWGSDSGSGPSPGSGFGHVPVPSDHVFVVHSQHSLENKKPPEIDNKTLARQKRKRTRYGCHVVVSFFQELMEGSEESLVMEALTRIYFLSIVCDLADML